MSYDFLNPFSLLLFGNTVFSFTLAIHVTSIRRNAVSNGLAGVLFGAGIWSIADGLRIAAPTADAILFWNGVTYVGIGIIPPATVLFVAAYTDHQRWLRRRWVGLLVAISVVAAVLALTNWRDLWRADETVMPGTSPPVLSETLGIAHVLWNVYVLFLIVPLLYVLLVRSYRSADSRLFRRQIGIMLVGLAGPVLTAALYVGNVTPIDLTPFGFTVFGIAVTVAVTRYRVLDVVPVARNAVVENADVGVFVLDHEDRVVDANPRAASIVGRQEGGIVDTHAEQALAAYDAVIEAIQRLGDERTTVTDSDESNHYRVDVTPIYDSSGHLLGRIVLFNDVTEQITRQQELVEKTETLERKNERLDQFASMVSHDLRNPLNVARLRLEQGMETDDRTAFESTREALDRMDRMIEQLLTLARVESTPREGEPVQLREVATRAWATTPAENATLTIEESLDEVEGDPDLLRELFENLFRNSVEHGSTSSRAGPDDSVEHGSTSSRTQSDDSVEHGAQDGPTDADDNARNGVSNDSAVGDPPGGPVERDDRTVTVTVGSLDTEGKSGFYVADDGSGIPADSRDQIFDHGYTTDRDSTGFGLSIVADIVAAHGWEISVTESDDGGARFEIRTE